MKRIILIVAVVFTASMASAAPLIQGIVPAGDHMHHWENATNNGGNGKPGIWEKHCLNVWNLDTDIQASHDGSGIVGYLGQTEVTPTSMHDGTSGRWQTDWWAQNNGEPQQGARNPAEEFLIYDLGEVKSLGNAYIWNGESSDVAVTTFNLKVSLDTDPTTATWTQVASGSLALPVGDIPAEVFAMNADARLVMLDIQGAWHNLGWAGISEIAFSESTGAPPVPEPAGLGLIGLALLAVRKRRS